MNAIIVLAVIVGCVALLVVYQIMNYRRQDRQYERWLKSDSGERRKRYGSSDG
jgi:heme/copper-type cytochrome/quinol oxidase subunit 2